MMHKFYRTLLLATLLGNMAWGFAQPLVRTGAPSPIGARIENAKAPVKVDEAAFRVLGLQIDETETQTDLSWTPASRVFSFRHDDGTVVDGLSLNNAGEHGVIGVAFPDIRVLERISWTLYDVFGSNDRKVNLFVFDLKADGSPDKTLLYSAYGVACRSLTAAVHDLCRPLSTPKGCFIALSSADGQALAIGMDEGKSSEWPFTYKVNYFNIDYTSSAFLLADGQGLSQNLFVRCYGEKESPDPVATEKYNVWRFAVGQENTPDKWSLLSSVPVEQPSFSDADYAGLAIGVYRYAVDLADASSAIPAVSCAVYKDMYTDVALQVNTTLPSEIPVGASVVLEGKTGVIELPDYTQTVSASGTVAFEQILKGTYVLRIHLAGFEPIEREVDLSTQDTYDLGSFSLTEYLDDPWALTVEKAAVPGTRRIHWNGKHVIFEDVEAHEDFTINSPGELGWSYIDGDQAIPYGINNCTFPNTGKPLAFIVFNPGLTSPAMSNIPGAISHSGQKYFAAFANMPLSAGVPAVANNDFIISPKLEFTSDFIFDFWAKSYVEQYSERFRVWYSVSGKEEKDFVYELTDGPVTAAAEWMNYSYKIPKEATYVAVNYVSQDQFFFMLDDLRFTEDPSAAVPLAFEVFLNDVLIDTVKSAETELAGLASGAHKVGIRALYRTGVSRIVEQEFDVTDVTAGLKAVVKDESGSPIFRASATLTGDFTYDALSDRDGMFLISDVQGAADYRLEIKAEGYKTLTRNIRLENETLDIGDIKMEDTPVKPGTVLASEVQGGKIAELRWRAPSDYMLFRNDNGKVEGGLGSNTGTATTVVGAAHPMPTELYSVSWFTATQGKNAVNVFVFDLDDAGMPVKTVLFEQREVENVGMNWNTLYFDKPVRCPRGFFIGLSGMSDGNVGLGADSGKDTLWPFVPKTNYLIQDYTSLEQEFNLLDRQFARNLMIRAEGSVGLYGKAGQAKAVAGYKVYRAEVSAEGDVAPMYVCLTPTPCTRTSFSDTSWNSLGKGFYRYGVRSVYATGDSSEMAYSNQIGRKVSTSVKISVRDANGPAVEAEVCLISQEGKRLCAKTDAAGVADFGQIATGLYDLHITKDGYADFIIYAMDFASEPSYNAGPYTLTEKLPVPTGLRVEESSGNSGWVVRWDEVESESDVSPFFLLDDYGKSGFFIYEVSLDGKPLAETAESFYRIGELKTGTYTAGVRVKSGFSYSEMATATFKVENAGIAGREDAALNIYPNPVTQNFFLVESVASEIESIEMTDIYGRKIEFSVSGSAERKRVELKGTVQGMILLQVRTDRGTVCRKIMIL